VLAKQYFKSGGVMSIKFGEHFIDYGLSFRIYLTSNLPNPHYPPELTTKVTLVNFTITKEGLEG